MSGFAQAFEFKTTRIDEIRQFNEEWRTRFPEMGPTRTIVLADRDNPNSYIAIAEFPSYEVAMKNSEDPATSEYAAKMETFVEAPPVFRNYDVVMIEEK